MSDEMNVEDSEVTRCSGSVKATSGGTTRTPSCTKHVCTSSVSDDNNKVKHKLTHGSSAAGQLSVHAPSLLCTAAHAPNYCSPHIKTFRDEKKKTVKSQLNSNKFARKNYYERLQCARVLSVYLVYFVSAIRVASAALLYLPVLHFFCQVYLLMAK